MATADNTDKSTYYEITYNEDMTEGRGGRRSTGVYFWNYSDAMQFVQSNRYADKWGIMGTCGSKNDIEKKTVKLPRIYDSLSDYDEENPNKEAMKRIRENALAKLTEVERKVLGFK